jgi:hypothetical protein
LHSGTSISAGQRLDQHVVDRGFTPRLEALVRRRFKASIGVEVGRWRDLCFISSAAAATSVAGA